MLTTPPPILLLSIETGIKSFPTPTGKRDGPPISEARARGDGPLVYGYDSQLEYEAHILDKPSF